MSNVTSEVITSVATGPMRFNTIMLDGNVFRFWSQMNGSGMHSLKQIHAKAGERYLSQKLEDKWRRRLKRALLAHIEKEQA